MVSRVCGVGSVCVYVAVDSALGGSCGGWPCLAGGVPAPSARTKQFFARLLPDEDLRESVLLRGCWASVWGADSPWSDENRGSPDIAIGWEGKWLQLFALSAKSLENFTIRSGEGELPLLYIPASTGGGLLLSIACSAMLAEAG